MPYQPGMAAGSVLQTCAIVTTTTFPSPSGLLTSTISSSIATPSAMCLGHRKWTPVELMLRVTKDIGDSSGTPLAPRRRSGSLRAARGYSRCSGCTPTACVGTRTKRRGCDGTRSGAMLSAGTRDTCESGCGPGAAWQDSTAGLADHDSNGITRFVALISPSRTPLPSRWLRHTKLTCPIDFLELPRPQLRAVER